MITKVTQIRILIECSLNLIIKAEQNIGIVLTKISHDDTEFARTSESLREVSVSLISPGVITSRLRESQCPVF